ncbi:glycosyltransferase family 2 protein [Pelistega europaea]|uniref:Glycosyltransferase family 2 protein n=1 Tax=Pelistega europaea TaxID=106147 RepID=A0A7Y4LAA4_9BURK|nr:glycosyltransferase family 2 protein [Pelistega europaea]NOL49909.1 glycosyltransferase family 2 protein [Pelistega europaea]
MPKARIALVVVTYNRCEYLEQMLLSAQQQTILPDCIYIIDNNSQDNTQTVVDEFSSESNIPVIYHNTGNNLGGAGGFAIGTKMAFEAGYDYLWLGDDDISFQPDCLENLLRHTPTADILQPMRLNTDGSCAELSGLDYQINNPFKLNPKTKKVLDIVSQDWDTIPITTIPFEGPLIHRKVFEKIGFPDASFFIFEDDLDFAIRARKAGFKIVCVKKANLIRHIPFNQQEALNSWKRYYMFRNFFRVQIRHGNKAVAFLRVSVIYAGASLISLIKLDFEGIKNLSKAYWDAFR